MRYTGFILLLVLAACSQTKEKEPSTPDEKAQAAITEMIVKELPHPESYQSVSFSELDSTFSDPQLDSAEYYQQMGEYYVEKAEQALMSDFKKSSMYSDSSIYFSKKVHEYLETHKGTFNGYVMEHTYQASSAANLMTKATIKVYFDPDLKIVSVTK